MFGENNQANSQQVTRVSYSRLLCLIVRVRPIGSLVRKHWSKKTALDSLCIAAGGGNALFDGEADLGAGRDAGADRSTAASRPQPLHPPQQLFLGHRDNLTVRVNSCAEYSKLSVLVTAITWFFFRRAYVFLFASLALHAQWALSFLLVRSQFGLFVAFSVVFVDDDLREELSEDEQRNLQNDAIMPPGASANQQRQQAFNM